ERDPSITLSFSGQELTLFAGDSNESQAKENLDIDMDGEDIQVKFNPNFLLEGLNNITEPFVHVKIKTATSPVEFNGQQEEDGDESLDYRYLVVPMRQQ
ncbi:MAG: DNA polymerase III subunit beta, partial [Lactobacillus iners]|nr:DNA polymerase III subunit beta [Lactobacillus iners]